MLRLLLLSLGLLFGSSVSAGTPQSAWGGGVGFISLIHADYQKWLQPKTSVELSLTPLVMLNVGTVALTQHVPVAPQRSLEQSLLLSGTLTTLYGIMDGSPAFGLGARGGYEWLGERRGLSIAAGPLGLISTGWSEGARFDWGIQSHMTLWFLKRAP